MPRHLDPIEQREARLESRYGGREKLAKARVATKTRRTLGYIGSELSQATPQNVSQNRPTLFQKKGY